MCYNYNLLGLKYASIYTLIFIGKVYRCILLFRSTVYVTVCTDGCSTVIPFLETFPYLA